MPSILKAVEGEEGFFMVLGNIDFCENMEELKTLAFNGFLILMAGQYFRIVSVLILKGEQ